MKTRNRFSAALNGTAVLFATIGLGAGVARAEWLSEAEISIEPAGKPGEMHYSVRLAPGKTQRYDAIVFELHYHQTFPWIDARGKRTMRVHEPVSFVYRRRSVNLVQELDHHISFRVPVDRKDLEKKYGEHTFNKGYPVTIERMTISGVSGKKTLWTYSMPARGKNDIPKLVAEQREREEREKAKTEDLSDLDATPSWLK